MMKVTYEFTPRSLDDRNQNAVEEYAESMMRSSSNRLLSSQWSVKIDPSFYHGHLRLERSLRASRPISHLVRESQNSGSSAVNESDEGVEDFVAAVSVRAKDPLGFLRSAKEFLRHRRAHRRNRFCRIPTLTRFVLRNDTSDRLATFLRFVDSICDDEYIGVGALKSVSIGVIFGSCGKDLIEEERILEAPLNGFDEERGEIPGIRSSMRERLAFREIGTKSWLEIL